MWVREAFPGDLVHIVENMRAGDAREVFALRPKEDRGALPFEIWAARGRALAFEVAGLDGNPNSAAFLGVWAMDETDGLCSANVIATPDFPAIAGAMVRRIRQIIIPTMLALGVRRVESRALAEYGTTRRFLRACGAREEAQLPDYGKNRETFTLYAWRKRDYETPAERRKSHVPREPAQASCG